MNGTNKCYKVSHSKVLTSTPSLMLGCQAMVNYLLNGIDRSIDLHFDTLSLFDKQLLKVLYIERISALALIVNSVRLTLAQQYCKDP
jgi:hypothetical protein